jgi:hypothetical protein
LCKGEHSEEGKAKEEKKIEDGRLSEEQKAAIIKDFLSSNSEEEGTEAKRRRLKSLHGRKENRRLLCSTQLFVHQRMNANGSLLPNDLFS